MRLSIIINTVEFDRVLYRTISSVFDKCINFFGKKEFEIFVVYEKEDSEEYKNFIEEKFGDNFNSNKRNEKNCPLSSTKNFIKGEYLLYLPSGCLLNERFIEKISEIKDSSRIFIPEYHLYIKNEFSYIKRISSSDKDFTISSLLWNNCFGEVFISSSELINKYFKDNGNESIWTFYCECISFGSQVEVLKKTIVFEEYKFKLFEKENLVGGSTLHKKEVLEKYVPKEDIKNTKPKISLSNLRAHPLYRMLRYAKRLMKLDILLRRSKKTNFFFKENWFKKAISNENKYSASLQNFTDESNIIESPLLFDNYYARDFCEIEKILGEDIDHLVFCPWLKVGGAEKVVFNLLKGLNSINKDSKIVLISLRKVPTASLSKIPSNVIFLDLGNDYNYTDLYVMKRFLATLLFTLRPKFIYNIGASEIFEMYQSYGEYLAKHSKFCTFFFSSRALKYNRYSSFGICYVNEIFDYSFRILSDNQNELNFLEKFYGLAPKEKLQVLYQPVLISENVRNNLGKDNRLRVLWASRLDEEKHPEVLLKIAKNTLDLPIDYFVFGQPVLNVFNTKKFDKVRNITYMGKFTDGIQSIDTDSFDLFIYTSEYDGMPNVILEAISVGLPILTSKVGGIPEIIVDNKTGLLVEKYDNISRYREKLEYIINNREILSKYAKNAQAVVKRYHSEKAYINRLRNILGI